MRQAKRKKKRPALLLFFIGVLIGGAGMCGPYLSLKHRADETSAAYTQLTDWCYKYVPQFHYHRRHHRRRF